MQKIIYALVIVSFSCHAGLVIDGKDAAKIAAAITTATIGYVGHELIKFYQPVIAPTQEQKLQYIQAKQKRQIIEIGDKLGDCLVLNKGASKVVYSTGVPEACSDLYNQFMIKAGPEEWDKLFARYKKLG